MSEFTVLVAEGNPQHVVIHGELDFDTAPQVDATFATLTGDVRVHCSDLSFIDSAGFDSFDRGYAAAMTRGSTFVVSELSDTATRIAELLALPYFTSAAPDA